MGTNPKRCSKCGEDKPESEYHRNKNSKDGLQHYCKTCSSERNAARYAAIPKRPAATGVVKTCTGCSTLKPVEEFYPYPKSPDGRSHRCKVCTQKDNVSNTELRRRSSLMRKYGITVEQYDSMLAEQGGRCACCGTDEPGGRSKVVFHVDHDHGTGAVRGLLCRGCNVGIGSLGDTIAGLEMGIRYLRSATGKSQEILCEGLQ
jgi:hypothetical protein